MGLERERGDSDTGSGNIAVRQENIKARARVKGVRMKVRMVGDGALL
jgi:hypothetical protein